MLCIGCWCSSRKCTSWKQGADYQVSLLTSLFFLFIDVFGTTVIFDTTFYKGEDEHMTELEPSLFLSRSSDNYTQCSKKTY